MILSPYLYISMNKLLKIGYPAAYFTDLEIVHLKDELIDCTLIPFSDIAAIEMAIESEEISAYAKKIEDIPIYTSQDPMIIAALVARYEAFAGSLRENIPANGAGIMGIVCYRNDIATRSLLAELHDLETGYCSNIERRIRIEFPKARVHCQIDRAHRYNLAVQVNKDGDERSFYFSQSTFVGLAEKAITEIRDS